MRPVGWRYDSARHSLAARGYSTVSRRYDMVTRVVRDGKKLLMFDDDRKVAKLDINQESDESMNISGWKSYVRGKGYGKKLLSDYVGERPDMSFIATDGLTVQGEENLKRALPEFRVIFKRPGSAAVMRQDAVDKYVELREGGGRPLFMIDPALHSRNSVVERGVVEEPSTVEVLK